MSKNYLENMYSFIEKAKAKNWTVEGPQHMPDNIAPDNSIYLCKAALEAKFNRKFTENEVIELIQPLPKKIKKDDVSLPQWYVDKWLSK